MLGDCTIDGYTHCNDFRSYVRPVLHWGEKQECKRHSYSLKMLKVSLSEVAHPISQITRKSYTLSPEILIEI